MEVYFFDKMSSSCDKVFLLPITRQQKVILKTSATSPVKLQLLIEGSHSDFQVCITESSFFV